VARSLVWIALALAQGLAAQEPAIDFSYAGYQGGGISTPAVPTVDTVRPSGGDDGRVLQEAIDRVSARPLRADGFRGAVLLLPGRYRVSGSLAIRASGVVLRGDGNATIVAAGKGRRTLIEIGGAADVPADTPVPITDEIVPAGGRLLTVENAGGLRVGDRIAIVRPSTAAWIAALHMTGLPGTYANQRLDWAPGSRNLIWDRTITEIQGRQIALDAPITTALERRYGGGTVARVTTPPVNRIGIEHLALESEFDSANPRDEEHSWIAVALDRVEDTWVRGVAARHFSGSAVRVGQRARRITIEACRYEQPMSEPAGYRRQSFLVEGQQVLVRQCANEQGMNDFAAGMLAAGPNVFLDSTARAALGPSGSFESWASGVLYENVRIEGAGIRLANDSSRSQGAGWTAANSVVWNCEAKEIEAHGPAGAENVVRRSGEPLYETHLARRDLADGLRNLETVRARAAHPSAPPVPAGTHAVEIVGGRFVVDGKTLWGGVVNEGWWRGQAVPAEALDVGGVSVTRFVPGRTGAGLTEDLPALVARMAAEGTPFYQSIPGLWYDRRRDEHSTVSRADANVWAPFYEMPWARSGQGVAADGLSRFDLSRFNPWYYERLSEFARLCDRYGLVFHHNLYNTHNLLEIPPHWVDYPWRPANNINETGLPEPPPVEPGNHIHVANQVYDVSHPVRRALHRAFILHELDELGGANNLFFSLGAQFAGPLSFQEFFHNTVAEWEKKTARRVRIELATSKDITDAILADPARARQVAVIDMRYWQYRPDGTLWAPPGGNNLAFREAITRDFSRSGDQPPDTTPEQVYRQVREYHDRYPDKAIVAWNGGAGPIPVLMAGGAEALMRNPSAGQGQGRTVDRMPPDVFVRDRLAATLMTMQPRDGAAADAWCLADERYAAVLLYSLRGDAIHLARPMPQAGYTALWFDPRTGNTSAAEGSFSAVIRKTHKGALAAAALAEPVEQDRGRRRSATRSPLVEPEMRISRVRLSGKLLPQAGTDPHAGRARQTHQSQPLEVRAPRHSFQRAEWPTTGGFWWLSAHALHKISRAFFTSVFSEQPRPYSRHGEPGSGRWAEVPHKAPGSGRRLIRSLYSCLARPAPHTAHTARLFDFGGVITYHLG